MNMDNATYCIADASFRSFPKEFHQMFTVHGEICKKFFPLIYIFMKDKSVKTYENAFKFLYSKNVLIENKTFKFDF
jgi:hypothetical protein